MVSNNKYEYVGKDLEAMAYAENYNKWIIDLVEPYFGNSVAEVGAGTGNLSKLILNKKIGQLVTFEPSDKMYEVLENTLNGSNNVITINTSLQESSSQYENHFDCILYINVLEHIEDDEKELDLVWDSLKNGGHVCIFVPALSWLYSDFDKSIGHYRRYYKSQLVSLFSPNKFKIIDVRYIDFLGILPWYIVFVLMKKTLTSNKTILYDKLLIPIIRIFESMIKIPVGKNLLLVAKKVH